MKIGIQLTRGITIGIENMPVAYEEDIVKLRGSILLHLLFIKVALIFENDEN